MTSTPSFPDSMAPVLNRIGAALIAATPEHWERFTLKVGVEHKPGGHIGMPHTVSSSEHPQQLVVGTEELFSATRELQLMCEQAGQPWKEMLVEVWLESGQWRFSSDFKYAV
jgi:hypothetical protein